MIFLIFILVPIIEISIFILIGSEIGVLNTIAIILLTALVGIYLVRKQGLSLLFNAQRNMSQGIFPTQEIKGGIFLLVSGLLLITPGFFTDTIGFLLLIPQARKFTRHVLINHTNWQHVQTNMHYSERTSDRAHDPNVIEAEYEEIKPDDKDR